MCKWPEKEIQIFHHPLCVLSFSSACHWCLSLVCSVVQNHGAHVFQGNKFLSLHSLLTLLFTFSELTKNVQLLHAGHCHIPHKLLNICPRIGIWQMIDNFTLRLESNNSLGQVTSLQLGSPVVELPSFSLWTGIFCSFSCVDDGTVMLLWLGPYSFVS